MPSACTRSSARSYRRAHSTMHLYPIDGAAARVGGRHAVRLPQRRLGRGHRRRGSGPGQRRRDHRLGHVLLGGAAPVLSAGGAYVNFMMDEGEDRIRASYRGNYERLAEVKAVYDPNNLFHINQNIPPAQ